MADLLSVFESLYLVKLKSVQKHTYKNLLTFRLQSVGEIWEKEKTRKPFGRLNSPPPPPFVEGFHYQLFTIWVVGNPEDSEKEPSRFCQQ